MTNTNRSTRLRSRRRFEQQSKGGLFAFFGKIFGGGSKPKRRRRPTNVVAQVQASASSEADAAETSMEWNVDAAIAQSKAAVVHLTPDERRQRSKHIINEETGKATKIQRASKPLPTAEAVFAEFCWD